MPEYWQFMNRLRQDLGKGYTVAEEHIADAWQINVLVRRQRHEVMLNVVTDTRWIAQLTAPEPSTTTLVQYKHLTVLVHDFFANPHALPLQTFRWPGTPEGREELRLLLHPRGRLPSTSRQ